jgi:MFS family permease
MAMHRLGGPPVTTTVPARIDRLPWSSYHTRLVLALGTCWILDGFEISVASNVGQQLAEPENLGITQSQILFLGAVYLLGEVVGALFFGYLADRLGRRRLYFVTLVTYFVGSGLTAFVLGSGPVALAVLYASRFVAGTGIGGEYAAINSAIDELVPAPYRGRVEIIVNGTYWAGAGLAAAVQIPLLAGTLPGTVDWRIAMLIGPVLAIGIFLVRRSLPESPRWLVVQGRTAEADRVVAGIEEEVRRRSGAELEPVDPGLAIEIDPRDHVGYVDLLRVLFQAMPGRAVLGATLMISQSFLYNGIFFGYASVLVTYFGVGSNDTADYLLPFALGNLLGPLLLGPLFDQVGRRTMISRTYVVSGLLLLVTAGFFVTGSFTAATQTLAWCVVFFFASAGASSAYLTVSEIFPMEVRAKAVGVFFAIAQSFGFLATLFYGLLFGTAEPEPRAFVAAYVIAAAFMLVGGLVARILGVDAENKALEVVARPLSQVGEPRHAATGQVS